MSDEEEAQSDSASSGAGNEAMWATDGMPRLTAGPMTNSVYGLVKLVAWLDERYRGRFAPLAPAGEGAQSTVERRTGETQGAVTKPASEGSEGLSGGLCGSTRHGFDCVLPAGHNEGYADVPERHNRTVRWSDVAAEVPADICGHRGGTGRLCQRPGGVEAHQRIGANLVHESGMYSWLGLVPESKGADDLSPESAGTDQPDECAYRLGRIMRAAEAWLAMKERAYGPALAKASPETRVLAATVRALRENLPRDIDARLEAVGLGRDTAGRFGPAGNTRAERLAEELADLRTTLDRTAGELAGERDALGRAHSRIEDLESELRDAYEQLETAGESCGFVLRTRDGDLPCDLVGDEHEDDGDGMIRHAADVAGDTKYCWWPKLRADVVAENRCPVMNPDIPTRCRYAASDERHEANDDDRLTHQDPYGYTWVTERGQNPIPAPNEGVEALKAARLALMRQVDELTRLARDTRRDRDALTVLVMDIRRKRDAWKAKARRWRKRARARKPAGGGPA